MSKQDLRQALEMLIDDPDLVEQFEMGDFSSIAQLDLNDTEQLLLRDAAADLPDVAGFYAESIVGVTGKKVKFDFPKGFGGFGGLGLEGGSKFNAAVKYLGS